MEKPWEKPEKEAKLMITTVMFDMDGTLIDTEKYYRRCWPAALAEFGFSMTDAEALEMRSLGRPFAPAKLKGMYGEDFDYEAVRNRRKELMEELLEKEGIRQKPGAESLLVYLREKGIRTAVVTATDSERTGRYLEKAGLDGFFSCVVCASMVEKGKPAPDIYLYACDKLGEKPEDCLAVEDSPNGVRSAADAGLKVVMVPDQTDADRELAQLLTARAENLEQVKDVLDRLA